MKTACIILCLLSFSFVTPAQIQVEVFGGEKRATIDLMFFKFFENRSGEKSKWFFFNRNRAGSEYEAGSQPQFGFTEAVSWNHPSLKGVAPVSVVQLFNNGTFARAGIQYALLKKNLTLFSWMVCETASDPQLDLFALIRYTPVMKGDWNWFLQMETLNTIQINLEESLNLTQRIRIGVKLKQWQVGAGLDLSQQERSDFLINRNTGIFVRHEFN